MAFGGQSPKKNSIYARCTARNAPCPIQNLMQRFQLLMAGRVIHIQLTGSKKDQGHCWKACPTFDNVQALKLHMPWLTCMGQVAGWPKKKGMEKEVVRLLLLDLCKRLHFLIGACEVHDKFMQSSSMLHFSICAIILACWSRLGRNINRFPAKLQAPKKNGFCSSNKVRDNG